LQLYQLSEQIMLAQLVYGGNMGKAFELPKDATCGECKAKINASDLFTIIYEDDNSGKIKHLQCDDCEVDDEIQHYRKTGDVSSHLSMEASMAHHYTQGGSMDRLRADCRHFYTKYKKDLMEIAAGNNKIQDAIRDFENKHWLPYLKKYWNDTNLRGHEAKVGKIKVMMWGCAGRVLITAERDNTDITMIFTDEKSQITANGGQQGIHGSHKAVLEILNKLSEIDKIKFKPADKVTLAGL